MYAAKTMVIAFMSQNQWEQRTMIEDQIIEQVTHFNYLANDTGHNMNLDLGPRFQNIQ